MLRPRSTAPLLAVGLLAAPIAARPAGVGGLATRVERAAAEAARAHVALPDRLEVLSARYGGADRIDAAPVDLGAARVEGPNRAGMLVVRFPLTVGGVPRGEARATVRGRLLGPALTATRTLVRGTPLALGDLEVVETDLTRLGQPPLREPAAALGRVPLRTLGKGRALAADLLGPAPVVFRGQLVELRIERASMTVRALGRALRPGAPGEVVPAENSVTGVTLEGRVQDDGSLLVLRHDGAGGW